MGYQLITIERRGNTEIVTISDEPSRNALSPELVLELGDYFDSIAKDSELRSVIITGSGKSFISGGDIRAMSTMTPEEAEAYAWKTETVYEQFINSQKIIIAAVNGFALGGGSEFTLACDFTVASDKAKFGFPEVTLGIIPGGGGPSRLFRKVGISKAKRLIYSGKIITAGEAEEIGLVDMVVPHDELLDKALELALEFDGVSGFALGECKKAVNAACGIENHKGMEDEIRIFANCFGQEDQVGRMNAFLNKNKK